MDDNLTHMGSTHGFSIPYQSLLDVDIATLISYLSFVIHGYKECLSCGTRRRTVEGIRQHMVAKAHCRFDITPDLDEFYNIPLTEMEETVSLIQPDDNTLRLPSGKCVSNRKALDQHDRRHFRHPMPEQNQGLPSAPLDSPAAPGTQISRRRGANQGREVVSRDEALLATQLTKLHVSGVRMQQKQENRKRGRLESANNIISGKHFRLDSGDGRISRKFCC